MVPLHSAFHLARGLREIPDCQRVKAMRNDRAIYPEVVSALERVVDGVSGQPRGLPAKVPARVASLEGEVEDFRDGYLEGTLELYPEPRATAALLVIEANRARWGNW